MKEEAEETRGKKEEMIETETEDPEEKRKEGK